MPRQTGLLCRNGRYYFNLRVPQDLRSLYGGKETFRESLHTPDYREAVSRARYRAFQLEAEFAEKRRKLRAAKDGHHQKLHELSDRDAHDLVFGFLISLEKESEKWWRESESKMGEDEREELVKDLRIDQMVFSGGSEHYRAADGSTDLMAVLEEMGWDCPQGSPTYEKLRELFRRARLENIRRTIDRLNHEGLQAHEELFRHVFAHSIPPKKSTTIEQLVTNFGQAVTEAKRTEGTVKTYRVPSRLLCEILGAKTKVDEITKADAERLLSLLRRTPSNATKKYRGMSLQAAIEAADADGNQDRLSSKTLENYFNNISTIFNFAVEKKMISENPFKDRWLRAAFAEDDDENGKAHFTIEELNKLFSAPLYTGCVDDEMGYGKAGLNRPRRGRFWVPLLSLFHGLRCNEAAQLYTEDVCDEEGIHFFEIRATLADGSKCDKHLKNKQSKRKVPLHPELIKMGFLDFVRERRADATHPRLFPDLPYSATGYFSNPFSKWFGRFKALAVGKDCEATFHSFRHHFRTALGEAGIPNNDVEMLGGWESGKRSSEKRYDRPTMARLQNRIGAVKYPGLELSHLYTQEHQNESRPCRRLDFGS